MGNSDRKIQIAHDPRVQKLVWRIQPVGWILLFALVAGGCLGLFGGLGPLNQTQQPGRDFTVHYDRFPPFQGTHDLRIEFQRTPSHNGTVLLAVDSDYLERMRPATIFPPPVRATVENDQVVYQFDFKEEAGTILLNLRCIKIGSASGRIVLGDSDVIIRQFVYP